MEFISGSVLVILFAIAVIVAVVVVPLVMISRSIRFVGMSFKKTYKKIRYH